MKDIDLLVIGEINPDLILHGDVVPVFNQTEKLIDDTSLSIGSSSVIMACGAARLGLKTAFMGVVGDDVFGAFMLDAMKAHYVDVSHCIVDKNLSTGFSVILVKPDSDRAILTYGVPFPNWISTTSIRAYSPAHAICTWEDISC
jgi:sugar/nucleoside kinase (ribokinase family)